MKNLLTKRILKNMKKTIKAERIIYCDNRECADMSCGRWIKHAPWDEVITVIRYELDKNGNCKHRLLSGGGRYFN